MRNKRMPRAQHLATISLIISTLTIMSTGCAAGASVRHTASYRTIAYAAYGAAWMQIYDAQMFGSSDPDRALQLWQNATALLEKAHTSDPTEPDINNTLAACYVRTGRSDDAARLLIGMIETTDNENAVFEILRLIPDTDLVVAAFENALAVPTINEKQRIRLLVNAGKYASANSLSQQAVSYFDAALAIDDSDSAILFAAASACAGAEQYNRGIEICLRYLNEDRDLTTLDAEAFMGQLVLFYDAADRYTAGLKFFEAAQKRSPDSELICQICLSFLEKSGRVNDAIARGEAFVKRLEDAMDVRIALVALYAKTNSTKTSGAMREILTLKPHYWRIRLALAEYLSEANKMDEAMTVLRSGLEESPSGFASKQIRLRLADYLEQSGARDEAIAELERILEDQPGDPQTCNYLGYIQAELGTNLEEAARLIKIALASDPENTAYLDSLAWVYYKMALRDDSMTRLRAADILLRKAINTEPVDPIIIDHLGDVCFVQGLITEAAANWEQVLSALEADSNTPLTVEDIQDKIDTVKKLIEQTESATRPPSRPLAPPPTSDNQRFIP